VEPGVSVVVTTWNGAARLPGTLAALCAQQVPAELRWEVIVVDNASTDDSARVARESWPADAPAPLTVVGEARQGVLHANHRGLAEARYALLSLVNDDNRPEPGWMGRAVAFMDAHPEAGAVGSRGVADPERPTPPWFERFSGHYAVGGQAATAGPLREPAQSLWGACTTYRTRLWRELLAADYTPRDLGRHRTQLWAGEDYELGYALRLAGFPLFYEPSLVFRHFIPAVKLDWRWHRRMHRGFGACVAHDAYVRLLAGRATSASERLGVAWIRESLVAAARLLRFSRHLLLGDRMPGDPAVVRADQLLGRLLALLVWRGGYDAALRRVRTAPWRTAISAT
jgi:GT2 family glycosyltransferase